MTLWQEQQDFVRNIKGAKASILLILLISGRSLTNRQLQESTGYSDKPVTDALAWLEPRGIVQYVGQVDGWTLGAGINRLPFSQTRLAELTGWLLQSGEQESPAAKGGHTLTSDSQLQIESYPQGYPPFRGEDRNYSEDRKLSDLGGSLVVSSSYLSKKELLTTNQEGGADRNFSELADWLERGGVAPGSRKMAFLLALGHSLDYIKAHVLEHLHELATWERDGNGRKPGTGTLIYRLEHGWPSPLMRCEQCLRTERECRCVHNQIPEHLKHIIKR